MNISYLSHLFFKMSVFFVGSGTDKLFTTRIKKVNSVSFDLMLIVQSNL